MSDDALVSALRKVVGTPPAPKANPITIFALICVAVTSAFLIGMSIWVTMLMSDSRWCDVALGADKAVRGNNLDAARACVTLLGLQITALSWTGWIAISITAACLLTLMVIVVANGQLIVKAGASGGEMSVGHVAPASAPPQPAAPNLSAATPGELETPRP